MEMKVYPRYGEADVHPGYGDGWKYTKGMEGDRGITRVWRE